MKEKLKAYLDFLFAGVPDDRDADEFKQEIYGNMCDRYDELKAEGKSDSEAYNTVLAGLGSADELITELESRKKQKYGSGESADNNQPPENTSRRRKSSVLVAIAVALYILCVIPVIALGEFGDRIAILGIALMFIMIAVATALLIYNGSMSSTDKEEKKKPYKKGSEKEKNPLFKAINSILWTVTVVTYILVSFLTFRWGITWIVFPIAGAISGIISAVFDLKEDKQ